MTKKDYELFANEIFRQWQETKTPADVIEVCKIVFAKDNPAFQPDKFERACYEGKHIRKSIANG
jgi:hypothetical protein